MDYVEICTGLAFNVISLFIVQYFLSKDKSYEISISLITFALLLLYIYLCYAFDVIIHREAIIIICSFIVSLFYIDIMNNRNKVSQNKMFLGHENTEQPEEGKFSEKANQSEEVKQPENGKQLKESEQSEESAKSEECAQTEEESEQPEENKHAEDANQSEDVKQPENGKQLKESEQSEESAKTEECAQTEEESEQPEENKHAEDAKQSEDVKQPEESEQSEEGVKSEECAQTEEESEQPEENKQAEDANQSEDVNNIYKLAEGNLPMVECNEIKQIGTEGVDNSFDCNNNHETAERLETYLTCEDDAQQIISNIEKIFKNEIFKNGKITASLEVYIFAGLDELDYFVKEIKKESDTPTVLCNPTVFHRILNNLFPAIVTTTERNMQISFYKIYSKKMTIDIKPNSFDRKKINEIKDLLRINQDKNNSSTQSF